MRTFTIVPSFEGESAFFELPDIGFQGDHLSFAILFNLTELTEHWPNIIPSMIVTDPKGNTFIAPHTSWNGESHIFTWAISSTETTYDGVVKCQLKCTSADDPETIVCMSRICQTRVYQSLEAASDPPEAFQSWIDTLVQLGADINADAALVLASVETTENNARVAQEAAESAELNSAVVEAARISIEQTATIAINAQQGATNAQQRAVSAATDAVTAKEAAEAARDAAQDALEAVDADVTVVQNAKQDALDAAQRAAASQVDANSAKDAAIAAKDAAVIAKGDAERARDAAEQHEDVALGARRDALAAQSAAEDAQGAAEDARDRALSYENESKKWAVGEDLDGNSVAQNDPTYENNSKYWAEQASDSASDASDYKDSAENARDTILGMSASAFALPEGSSPTVEYQNGHMKFGIPKGDTGLDCYVSDEYSENDLSVTLNFDIGRFSVPIAEGTTDMVFDSNAPDIGNTVIFDSNEEGS